MFDACTEEPESAWQAILEIVKHSLNEEQVVLLGAGAVETLLAWHGAAFIDRVVEQAQRDPKFNRVLGAVWRQDMPNEIWTRIERVRKEIL
jgi:hypothetical protein